MIKEIDELMVHWGEQHRQHGLGAGIGSQMGSIMQWKGCAPRGAQGPRILTGGLGMDYAASEVDSAVAMLERSSKHHRSLAKFARCRYVEETSIRETMRLLGIPEGADRTYRNWQHRLHLEIQAALSARATPANK